MGDNKNGVKPVLDDEGNLIWNITEYNGRIYGTFRRDLVERIDCYKKSFPVKDNDIYLVTYPKSGTHWTWEILNALKLGAVDTSKNYKWQMLETGFDITAPFPTDTQQRLLVNHLRLEDMPPAMLSNKRATVIQVHRNPADVAVSLYHHTRKEVNGVALSYEWDDYISKLFCDRHRMINGTWFDYTCEWWTHGKNNPNYLPVFYEELKENPVKEITRIAEFLEVKADKELIQSIADQTAFQTMKEAKREKEAAELKVIFAEGFSMYRKGVVGDWRNHFTKEQHQKLMECYNQQLQDFPELHKKFLNYLQW